MNQEKDATSHGQFDRFTRIYLSILGAIAAVIVLIWLFSLNPRVWEINDLLEDDPLVSSYVYPFRVVSLENGVAEISSPRSYEVPVMRFLTLTRPALSGRAQDDPAMVAAQEELVRVQKRAQEIVQALPDVKIVRWSLDRDWYRERGIQL